MRPCKHTYIMPVGYARDSQTFDPGICGTCGCLIDIRTCQPMTPIQIEQWADERADRRIMTAETIILASEAA